MDRFCQYRKFWSITQQKNKYTNLEELNLDLIKKIPEEYDKFETILGEPLYINQLRLSKFFKNFLKIIFNPNLLYDKNKRSIKFHFDLMHGEGNLIKQSLTWKNDRNDFNVFVNTEVALILIICLFVNLAKFRQLL